jgi:hypothetical protein
VSLGQGAMSGLAEVAIVQRGDVSGNQLSLGPSKSVLVMQKNLRELAHGAGGIQPEREESSYSRQPFL